MAHSQMFILLVSAFVIVAWLTVVFQHINL